MQFAGARLPSSKLRDVYSYLLCSPTNSEEWALHELAVALKASLGRQLRWMRLLTQDSAFLFSGSQVEQSSSRFSQDAVIMDLGHIRSLRTLVARHYPESERLMKALTYGTLLGRIRESGVIFESRGSVDCNLKEPLMSRKLEGGWLALGGDGELGSRSDSKLTMLIRGRCFEQPLRIGTGLVRALIKDDEARLDLSQAAPVEDANFRARLAEIASEFEHMCLDWVSQPQNRNRESLYPRLAGQVLRQLRTRGRLEAALDILSGLPRRNREQAALLHQLGRVEEAIEVLNESLSDSPSPHFEAAVRLDLADLLSAQDQQAALDAWYRGYELLEELHRGRKDHLLADAWESRLWWREGATASDLTRVMELKRQLGQQHRQLCSALELGAFLHLREADPKQALKLLERAWEIRCRVWGEGNPIVAPTLTLLSVARAHAGDQ
ncbi:MAG: hypothetical protein KC910_36230, partial [Candidatus Eremiobacteraeota bacterium]|nr:hypothetical protein [Candidatus Eremiobacteraeota bacterium]